MNAVANHAENRRSLAWLSAGQITIMRSQDDAQIAIHAARIHSGGH
jgi:hypothetical protein